jgi:hypothetical protein
MTNTPVVAHFILVILTTPWEFLKRPVVHILQIDHTEDQRNTMIELWCTNKRTEYRYVAMSVSKRSWSQILKVACKLIANKIGNSGSISCNCIIILGKFKGQNNLVYSWCLVRQHCPWPAICYDLFSPHPLICTPRC